MEGTKMSVRRSRATQQGPGPHGKFAIDSLNLVHSDNDPIGFFRTENRSDERPFAYMPALPAIGVDAHINIWQFKSAYDVDTTNVWRQVNAGSGTALIVQDARGGLAKVTNTVTEDNYYGYFSKYEVAKLQAGKGLWLHGLITLADADDADWFFGLCKIAATTGLFDARVDSIGFYGVDGSVNINCEGNKNSTPTQSTAKGTMADATQKELAIYANGVSRVDFYIENAANKLAYVATITTNLPDDEELAVAFGVRNGASGANSLTTGRILLLQDI